MNDLLHYVMIRKISKGERIMDKFYEKTIRTEKIFSGKIIHVQVDDVELPNGKTSKREIVKHPGAVGIIPITLEGKIVMVRQFRKPLERSLLEIPAGKLEPNEKPEVTARRELEEETGYTTNQLDHIISFYTAPGFSNEIIHLYVAKDLQKTKIPLVGDEDEFVEVRELTLEEAVEAIQEKQILDAKTVYAVLYLQLERMKN